MTLYRRIQQWRQVQIAYTPVVASLLVMSGSDDEITSDTIENPNCHPLYLPSSIPFPLNQGSDVKGLAEKECRLRIAQASEALSNIRRG